MANAGEKPGAGTYICQKCGKPVFLSSDTDTLPPCPKCGYTVLRKAEAST